MKFWRMTIALLALVICSQADAQSWQMNSMSFALKAGESVEVMDLYWVSNCRSQLTAPPEVTILDGPPGVSASVTDAMVTPRFQQCARPVKGGKLVLKAETVDDPSQSVMTVRVAYKTKDGLRERSLTFTLALFPAS